VSDCACDAAAALAVCALLAVCSASSGAGSAGAGGCADDVFVCAGVCVYLSRSPLYRLLPKPQHWLPKTRHR